MFTMILTVLIFGFLMGGIVAWLSAGKSRIAARQNRYRADKAERELRNLSNKLDDRARETQPNTSIATVPATNTRA
jgi:biopolymer transport protein ExbB/TolQ